MDLNLFKLFDFLLARKVKTGDLFPYFSRGVQRKKRFEQIEEF